jgi:hypothetical protein
LRVDDGEAGWGRFKDALLASPLDVEELARMGRSKQVRLDGAGTGDHVKMNFRSAGP